MMSHVFGKIVSVFSETNISHYLDSPIPFRSILSPNHLYRLHTHKIHIHNHFSYSLYTLLRRRLGKQTERKRVSLYILFSTWLDSTRHCFLSLNYLFWIEILCYFLMLIVYVKAHSLKLYIFSFLKSKNLTL